MTPREWLLASLVAMSVGLVGWQRGPALLRQWLPPDPAPRVIDGLQVETVIEGLEHPWSVAFLSEREALITERPGRLRLATWSAAADGRVSAPGQLAAPVTGVPSVLAQGQGGLFDVLPDRDFARNQRIYLSYAEADAQDPSRSGVAVLSARLDSAGLRLHDQRVIFRQTPKVASAGHFGGRLVQRRDGSLLLTLGDRQRDEERGKAQDPARDHGKVVRFMPDGRVPTDNPFVPDAARMQPVPTSPGPSWQGRPWHWSLGHRNPQGAALHPVTDELWLSEHGPQGGDEINRVLPGRNYGWPLVTQGCEYGSCEPIGRSRQAGMEEPLTVWLPRSIAPSGLMFNTGKRYPGWEGQLFSGALAGQALWRLRIEHNRVVEREALLAELGERLRDVRLSPDGWIHVLTDSPHGRLLRLRPEIRRE